jgi:DNA polymerase
MKEQLSELVDLIDKTEDIICGGWRREHKPLAAAESEEQDSLDKIAEEIKQCRRCGLSGYRKTPVPGEGVLRPRVMFIGEGPGAEEDKTGRPFVGRAGQYLDKWLAAIDLDRGINCFIGNIIKCRPPENRDPHPEEIIACKPFLLRQLAVIKPEVIVTLGRFASQVICSSEEGIGRLRGRVYSYHDIPVVPTYHPSAVLRNQDLRPSVWDDLKKVKELWM